MEAAVYVWQDSELDAKPTGSLERVYLTAMVFLPDSPLWALMLLRQVLAMWMLPLHLIMIIPAMNI